MDVDREAEVGRQVAADLMPRLAGIVAAHDVPVLLHEQHARAGAVPRDAVHAVTDLGRRVRNLLGAQAAIHRPPRLAAIVGAEDAGRGDRDEDPPGLGGIQEDRVQAHSAGAGLPETARFVRA